MIKGKTQKVHCAEITSPGRQVGLVGFHRRVEGCFIFPLPGQGAGMPAREAVRSLLGSLLWLKVFQGRLLSTLAPCAQGFLLPCLWHPFLNLLQPGEGCRAQLCQICFFELDCFMDRPPLHNTNLLRLMTFPSLLFKILNFEHFSLLMLFICLSS